MIEKWEQNRIPNCLLTNEEYEELTRFKYNDMLYYCDGKWISNCIWSQLGVKYNCSCSRNSNIVHRLRPDYQPPQEPKIKKFEIVRNGSQLLFESQRNSLLFSELHDAVDNINFSHFENSAGTEIDIKDIAKAIRNNHRIFVVFVETK